jgi:hypothetical protein
VQGQLGNTQNWNTSEDFNMPTQKLNFLGLNEDKV